MTYSHLVIPVKQILADTPLQPDFPMQLLATKTEGLSGSDLKEMCRSAAMVPVREYLKEAGGDRETLEKGQLEVSLRYRYSFIFIHQSKTSQGFRLRPLKLDDFFYVDASLQSLPVLHSNRTKVEESEVDLNLD